MPNDDNVARLMAAIAAFNENDMEGATRFVAPDVTYIIRGQASVSGTYHGLEGFADALQRIKDLTAGTMAATPEAMLSDSDTLMMYAHVTATRPDGRGYDNYQMYLYRFRDGMLVEGQTIPVDQQAFAEFLSD